MRVLLVEDEPGDIYLAEYLFRKNGMQWITVESLSNAMEAFEAGSFDLVLLDLGLPDSAGATTLNSFHRSHPSAVVLVWSGIADKDLARRLVGKGARGFITKTFLTFESDQQLLALFDDAIHSNKPLSFST